MDQKERSADDTAALKTALAGWQRGIWTALPAIVQNYNAADNTISAQPSVRAVLLKQDPKTGAQTPQSVNLPLLVKVPVVFPAGGSFVLTFPIAAGDEVLVVFASRCIDGWWQSGGVQNQIEYRAHDLSDGIAIPGLTSIPRVPGGISGGSAQLRSRDGAAYLEVASGHVLNIVAPGGLNVTGNTIITGNLSVSGTISAGAGLNVTGDITCTGNFVAGYGGSSSVNMRTHTHSDPQGGLTGPPTPGS